MMWKYGFCWDSLALALVLGVSLLALVLLVVLVWVVLSLLSWEPTIAVSRDTDTQPLDPPGLEHLRRDAACGEMDAMTDGQTRARFGNSTEGKICSLSSRGFTTKTPARRQIPLNLRQSLLTDQD